MNPADRKKLGEILVEAGLITQEQLEGALKRQTETRRLLGPILIEMGLVTDQDIMRALADQLSIPSVDLSKGEVPAEVATLLPEEFCRQHHVVPILLEGDTVTVAVGDPTNVFAMDLTRGVLSPRRAEIVAASDSDIIGVINRTKAKVALQKSVRGIPLGELTAVLAARTDKRLRPTELADMARLPSVVDLSRTLLHEAQRSRATHVYIDPGPEFSSIRLLSDGATRHFGDLPAEAHDVVAARFKMLADLNLATTSVAQQGVLGAAETPQGFEVGVSALPTVDGERIAIRLLRSEDLRVGLSQLGMSQAALAQFGSLLAVRRGLLAVAGPAHSGMTSTLYAIAVELTSVGRNVVTIEQPVERHLSMVSQVPLMVDGPDTFASMITHVRRQDADVIVVGATPDRQTTEAACSAAVDCLVVAAVRAESVARGLRFFLNAGLDPYALGTCLAGATAQRLVRLNCVQCAHAIEPSSSLWASLMQLGTPPPQDPTFRAGRGCTACGESGFGRAIAVFEVAAATPELCEMLETDPPATELDRLARDQGMQPLGEQILARAWRGETSPAEALRVGLPERSHTPVRRSPQAVVEG